MLNVILVVIRFIILAFSGDKQVALENTVLVQIPMVETLQRMSIVELLSRPEQLPRLPTLWPVGSLAFRS
jgi:hypothetical protein